MILKDYKNKIYDLNIGSIIDGFNCGNPSYYEIPEIKEVLIDDKWIPNPGFDLEKMKTKRLSIIESQIIDVSLRLDKANSLNLQTQTSELTAHLGKLNKQRDEINAI